MNMRKRVCNVKFDAFKRQRAKCHISTDTIAVHLIYRMRCIRKALAKRRGIALALVLWLIAILALIAAGLSWTARSEVRIAALQQDGVRALYLARAGLAHAIHLLAQDEQPYFDAYTESWAFIDSAQEGIFDDEYGRYIVRVEDDAGKLNINVASRDELLTFFQGDESIVDAILDWRDEDDVPNPNGAESDYYQSLPLPYQCRNAPFETIHELLLVRGMTPDLFYGGFTELVEGTSQASYGTEAMGTSFKELMTVYSAVPNVSPDGEPLVNLNTASREEMQEALGDVLTDEEIDAIIRFRESGQERGEGVTPSGGMVEQPTSTGAPSQPSTGAPQSPTPTAK
ncbi:MAG TPA: hypothetical protein EYP10_15745, partial [Armatimonadetes bacterium]|nr:hypothetical protein [Armatimonadota bacterium]